MSNPYREAPPSSLACPRCNKRLPPEDLAACVDECGTWISADAAAVALAPEEIEENRQIQWERVRAPCPHCRKQMKLRGQEPGLFQGCTAHGYWVDADLVEHTGLGRTDLRQRLEQMRVNRDAFRIEQAKRDAEERAKEAEVKTAEEQRKRAWIGAKRNKIVERVNAALASGDSGAIVDELLRLETLIEALADRLTDVENELDAE